MMSSPAQFLSDLPEFHPDAVAPGLPLKLENSPAGSATDQRKAQKAEGFRLAEATLLAVMHRVAAELDQACLLRVKRQRELLKPLSHHVEEPMRVGPALEANH